MIRHIVLFLVSVALAIGVATSPASAQPTQTHTYYVAADEVEWNYAPSGINQVSGKPFEHMEKIYTERGPHRIGLVYRKAVYREYTDATFTTLKPPSPQWEHLGILGPVLRAEVGDTIKVVFRNNGTHPYSMHPHGVFYNKDSEGVAYDGSGSGPDDKTGVVAPGQTHTYTWEVPERAGPGPGDPSSIVWLYHSHVNELKDVNAGLVGAIIVNRRGMSKPDGTPKDVDREFVALFNIFDENQSWYLDHNIQTYAGDPKGVKKDEIISLDMDGAFSLNGTGFADANLKFTINGFIYGQRANDDHEERGAGTLVSARYRVRVQLPYAALARQHGVDEPESHRCHRAFAGTNGDRGHGSRRSRYMDVPLPCKRSHAWRDVGPVPRVALADRAKSGGSPGGAFAGTVKDPLGVSLISASKPGSMAQVTNPRHRHTQRIYRRRLRGDLEWSSTAGLRACATGSRRTMSASTRPIHENHAERQFEGFENLMPFRVNDILLVSSLYDSFILREDGRLNELLMGDSLELDIHQVPGITHVPSGAKALELARSQPRFNLIVTNLQVGDMDAAQLAREIKAAGLDVPVIVLAYDYREIKNFIARNPQTDIERIFLWQGNARILISIVKYIEDKRNVLHDTHAMSVPVMLVVEDDIRYYSLFLPVIYTELISQSRRLLSEGLNVAHKLVRMRARPKILLCSNYEDAEKQVMKYRDYLLGVVSDVEFPRNHALTPEAGFQLARMIRSIVPDVPIVLQSSRTEFMPRAYDEGFGFLQKRSPTLLGDLRRMLVDEAGFGDFVFRLSDGKTEVGRASNLNQLETQLATVPAESVEYHAQRNHFSHWLMARTEFALAQKLRPRKVSDFEDTEHLRRDLIASIAEYRREQSQTLIGEFNPATFQPADAFFLQIGGGSLGGKARGLAFIRHLLHQRSVMRRFPGIRIAVPPTLVLATDLFDNFLRENNLLKLAIHGTDDQEIVRRFLAAPLPIAVIDKLLSFLYEVRYPLAVRSSSLLEDSQYQPFSGVYETFMLGNHHLDIQMRLEQLLEAIKRVYASTFSQHAKSYVRATPYRLEEEKMAVLVQQVAGATHGHRFYPDFSGVVRSRNFYPVGPVKVEDGFAAVALGLGCAVVTGGKSLTFSPRHPRSLVQFSSVEDILANSQTEFWALNLDHAADPEDPVTELREVAFGLDVAEADGTLQMLGSTYSEDNHAVYDGLSRPGPRIVSFAPILKHGMFPLPAILDQLMSIGEDAMGRPVEIEFAVRLPRQPSEAAEFSFLQLRPLVLARGGEEIRLESVEPERLVCQSSQVLGHGRLQDLRDAIVVDFHRFERARSAEVAQSVAHFNAQLCEENTPYLLIGVGRWGSTDPWLGIPVAWDQISGARVIVESGFRDLRVVPSQGSHFFQNLTAFQIGYFTVNPDAGEGFVDWQWLAAQPAIAEHGCVRHLRFATPLVVLMNGKTSQGMIFKPEPS